MQEVGQRLGLSTRQTHRSMRKAEESGSHDFVGAGAVGGYGRCPRRTLGGAARRCRPSLPSQKRRCTPRTLGQLLQEAQKGGGAPGANARVTFQRQEPWPRLVVSVDTAVSRQLLVSVLSRLIQATQQQTITLHGTLGEEMARLTLTFPAAQPLALNFVDDQVIAPLAERLGWLIAVEGEEENGRYQLQLQIPLHGPVVLVVDDDPSLVRLFTQAIKSSIKDDPQLERFNFIPAYSGNEALSLLNTEPVDAVLLDLDLPDIHGTEVLATIKKSERFHHLPVIIISASDITEEIQLTTSANLQILVNRPFEMDELSSIVRAVLGQVKPQFRSSGSAPQLRTPSA